MFSQTSVSHSVHGVGGYPWSHSLSRRWVSLVPGLFQGGGWVWLRGWVLVVATTRTIGGQADGTHPTGMHSYLSMFPLNWFELLWICNVLTGTLKNTNGMNTKVLNVSLYNNVTSKLFLWIIQLIKWFLPFHCHSLIIERNRWSVTANSMQYADKLTATVNTITRQFNAGIKLLSILSIINITLVETHRNQTR